MVSPPRFLGDRMHDHITRSLAFFSSPSVAPRPAGQQDCHTWF
nr:unnamed protein product [Digitaria exilis]